jgi:1-acyl-sn-glycerol-3-phosphate acyltransferase
MPRPELALPPETALGAGSQADPTVARARGRAGPVRTVAGALAVTGALVPAYMALKHLNPKVRRSVPRFYHSLLSRSFGIRTHLHGVPETGSVLYVANHLSWLDIPVIGSRLEGSFVAKAEVEDMAGVGFLADLQDTLYVSRERRFDAQVQANAMAERLATGDNLILFPEGTSNDGVRLKPFKSSLFAAVEGLPDVRIQPVTLAYTEANGLPLTRHRLVEFAWLGDMGLAPHAFEMMRVGRVRADILCHPAIPATGDRKALARHCADVIGEGYSRLVRGVLQ